MATNTRKLAALLGSSGANIADSGTINTAGITADAIDNTKIADNAVNADSIAANAVGTSEVADNVLTATDLAANSVGESELSVDYTAQSVPHIVPGVLYPSYNGSQDKQLNGTSDIVASTTGPAGSTVTSSKYGTVQSDGRMYYYTDIKGSKPIKDPRIGAHFGSQRHKFKSIQLLEQETATHGKNVYSVDGREWIRAVGPNFELEYNTKGNGIKISKVATDTNFIEIVGYFNDANIIRFTAADNKHLRVALNGGTIEPTDLNTAVDSPLSTRYVDDGSVINLSFHSSSTPVLGINTVKILNTVNDEYHINGIELITQDTSSTANRSKIQIPAQNVVSYGKKFSISSASPNSAAAVTPHYDPFNGFTNSTTAWPTDVDTDTSLGLANWQVVSGSTTTRYRPYNGGRVVKWVDSSGVIKTSVTMMPPNARNGLGTAITAKADASVANNTYLPTFEAGTPDHSLSEVAKTFHWREFGNGGANAGTGGANYPDASMLNTSDDIAYVMDDGLTSLSGDDVALSGTALGVVGSGDFWYLTFIGTGISTEHDNNGNRQIAQNLPYGTHIIKNGYDGAVDTTLDGVNIDSTSSDFWEAKEFTFHQPKRPSIPEDACVLADYMLMADFVPLSGTGSQTNISKGVRLNSASRDVFYNESDGDSFVINATELEAVTGMNIYLNGVADGVDKAKIRLPSFATNYVVRGYRMEERARLFIGDTDKDATSYRDDTTNRGSYAYITNNSGNSATISSNETLGVNNFGLNAENNKDPYIGAFEIATPIHTSSHYQSFETPFLHELIGGDRNMEQTNLVVSPDGKTWDQLTRDTSYIGNGKIVATTDHFQESHSAVVVHDEFRGQGTGFVSDLYNKDFAIGYDRFICLKDGIYKITANATTNYEQEIHKNGQIILQHDPASAGVSGNSMSINVLLKRGDYVQKAGGNKIMANQTETSFIIERI